MDFGYGAGGDLRDLAKLLKTDVSDHDDSDEESCRGRSKADIGPGSLGQAKPGGGKSVTNNQKEVTKDPKKIWDPEEAKTTTQVVKTSIENDPRLRPAFETYYRQSVSTEDMFLQMGMKTPCTSSCEHLVVTIHLPGENFQQVQLDIKPDLLMLRSPKYIFRFPTPHPVDPNGGNAKWDQDKEKLTVTLQLSRELDALNF